MLIKGLQIKMEKAFSKASRMYPVNNNFLTKPRKGAELRAQMLFSSKGKNNLVAIFSNHPF